VAIRALRGDPRWSLGIAVAALVQLLQWEVDRVLEVLLAELLRQQDLGKLGALLGDQPQNLVVVDRLGASCSYDARSA
jgi:hypothetical protein